MKFLNDVKNILFEKNKLLIPDDDLKKLKVFCLYVENNYFEERSGFGQYICQRLRIYFLSFFKFLNF